MERAEYEIMAAVEDRHWWYSGMRALAAAWLDDVYGDRSDVLILDAGCGTGGNADFLRRYGRSVGLDLERVALQLGQQRLPGRLAGGSVVELPFPDACFDLLTSFDVLYHRAVLDERAALREVWRVLRPGGRLLIRLPAYQWLYAKHDRAVHTRHRYTAGETHALLTAAGLRVERLSYINSLLFPLVLGQRMLERVRARDEHASSDMTPPGSIVNTVLRTALQLEATWLQQGGSFAWGLSVLALARKPAIKGQGLGIRGQQYA